jgi:predicted NBD/HSP70 family sugar kinase
MSPDWRELLKIRQSVVPPLDREFLPAALVHKEFRRLAAATGGLLLRFALERSRGAVSVYETRTMQPSAATADLVMFHAERTLKFLLWQRGAWKVHVGGPPEIGEHLRAVYSEGGARKFDYRYMSNLFERPFTVVPCAPEAVPPANEAAITLGRHLDGCRVGFDLGASDRKACALQDGRVVYSEEVPWNPSPVADPEYHYREIMDSIRSAASRLPRLDAVGGSAAGVYIDNRVRAASLFRGVPAGLFEEKVAGLFLRIRDELGVPLEVINDGEVTALAGSMSLGRNPVLGIAMGSSEAAGYIDAAGRLTGWLDELAFVPIDYRKGAPVDEWSGDEGCGVQYLSQVGAIRVAEGAGMSFAAGSSLPEKLVQLQERMKAGEPLARLVYETVGAYLGYALAHYADFYDLAHVLVLGRVTTGPGGEVIVAEAEKVLRKDFPELSAKVAIALPDESSRRVGQAIAAASLPEIQRKRP